MSVEKGPIFGGLFMKKKIITCFVFVTVVVMIFNCNTEEIVETRLGDGVFSVTLDTIDLNTAGVS